MGKHTKKRDVKKSVNIRPGVGILGLFPAMNYKAWYALGELVDNALDSYLLNRHALRKVDGADYRLRIVITIESTDGGFIRVWDNAAGIDATSYERAFVTAEPPPDSAGLSQFGIGLKSASCWFAREWRVTSTALGEDVERTIEFDVPAIIAKGTETLEAQAEPADPDSHFTEVRLWNLHKPPQTQTIGKIKRHLTSMYRQFLRSGEITISINGDELTPDEPEIAVVRRFDEPDGDEIVWKKEIDFSLSEGERVKGWAAILQKGSTRHAGFALFRHNRLIVGSDDEPYRPAEVFGGSNSFRSQRVFGELHLDDFDVTHTKDGFVWGEREGEFVEKLKEALDAEPLPILKQAERYRAREATEDFTNEATKAVTSTAAVLVEAEPLIEDQVTDEPVKEPPPESFTTGGSAGKRTLALTIKNEPWEVTIDLTTDPAAREWVEIIERPARGSRKIGIRLSLSHPFTQRFGGTSAEDIEGLLRVAAGLCIAETTARFAGVGQAGTVRRNLNELLLNVLSKP